MAEFFYVECIHCGIARCTDSRASAREFQLIHRRTTGHANFYLGDPPADRARRIAELRSEVLGENATGEGDNDA